MTPSTTGGAVAALLAFGAMCVGRGIRRAPRTVATARRMMSPATAPATNDGRWIELVATGPIGEWTATRWGGGLATIGVTASAVVARALTNSVLALLTSTVAVATFAALGTAPTPIWWYALPPIAAGAMVVIVVNDVSARIATARRAVRSAATDFVQLVAVGLAGDQSVEEAVRFALDVIEGDGAAIIAERLGSAPLRGVPLWDTLDELGTAYDVRELCEFAGSLERQATQGVAIGDTALSLSVSMRRKALDDLERAADRANANLAGPTVGFVIATVVFLAYPLAQRISDAFGG